MVSEHQQKILPASFLSVGSDWTPSLIYTVVLKRDGMYRNENITPLITPHTTHTYHFPHTIAYLNILI